MLLIIFFPVIAAKSTTEVAVKCSNQTCVDVSGNGWTAIATFADTVDEKGWAEMLVKTEASADDFDQAFAAGYAEAAVSWRRTYEQHMSFVDFTFLANGTEGNLKTASEFVSANDAYIRSKIDGDRDNLDMWWRQIALVWTQLDGMLAGYNAKANATAQLRRLDFLLLNAVVDLSSIIHKPFDDDGWTRENARIFTRQHTHCSALVKVADDFSELYTSHNTWTTYMMMLRVSKTYFLPFRGVAAKKQLLSGYFGILASTDDFFVLDSGLVVQETTNAVYNKTLVETIVPTTVLTWARSLVANRLATDGKTWTQLFVQENSGTINNQWMIVDYNKFEPGRPLPPNTLWIVEQLPGYTERADVTDYLSLGYWPSYNRPFFRPVRERSGLFEMAAKFGDHYTYSLYSRAKIFRRDHHSASTREGMRELMRYNDWQHDPFSNRSAEDSIAARDDLLLNSDAAAFGNIDAKLVDSADVRAMRMEAISGPTHETQPVFDWNESGGMFADATAHFGQPKAFAFDWEVLPSRALSSYS